MLWVVGVLVRGVEAIWAFLFRRRRSEVRVDSAEELRLKLAAARELEDAAEPQQGADAPVEHAETISEALAVAEESDPAGSDLESYRRRVHERARALTEEMRGAGRDA